MTITISVFFPSLRFRRQHNRGSRVWKWLLWLFVAAGWITAAPAKQISEPLHKFAVVENVTITCVSSDFAFDIPIPERWDVKKGILKFNFTNSIAVLRQNSQIVVKLNGYPLAQIRMNPRAPEGEAEIELAGALLRPGYNTVQFSVAQHYSLECEAPCAPELWTTLKLGEATLELDYVEKPVPLSLSALSHFVFDPRIFPQPRVNFVQQKASPESLKIASVVASGVALRFDYRNVLFSVSDEILPRHDNVLVGTAKFVQKFLRRYSIDLDVDAPLLQVLHLPVDNADSTSDGDSPAQDPTKALLVVSGTDTNQVKLAAETLAILSYPFPKVDKTKPLEFELPEIALYSGKFMLTPDKKYEFETLDFQTHTFKGIHPASKHLRFRLSPDFAIKPNQYVDLSLDFSYGAGIRSDSSFNILLNDNHVAAVHLDNPHGAFLNDYKVSLPTHLFRRGTNVLTFAPVLTPSVTELCSFVQSGNLFLTLFGHSTLYFPGMPHRVDLPRIELFFTNGFPFTRWPDGYDSLVYLPKPEPDTIMAALNVIGLISRKNGYPLFGMEFTFTEPKDWQGELMVIGTVGNIPEKFHALSPLRLTEKSVIPYPIFKSWQGERIMALSQQISQLGADRSVMMEFESPYREGRSVLLLTAASASDILKLSEAMLDTTVQAQAAGDLVILDFPRADEQSTIDEADGAKAPKKEYGIFALKIGKTYFTGKEGKISKIDYYLHSYPALFLGSLIGSIVVLTMAVAFFIRRHRAKRIRIDAGSIDNTD